MVYFGYESNGVLGSLVLPSSLQFIGSLAFVGTGWTSVVSPDNCVFENNGNLFARMPYCEYLKIGEGPSDFTFTFQMNPVLKTLVLPSTARTFRYTASFSNLPKLTTIQIYANKGLVDGSSDPDSNWGLHDSDMAPNATVIWMNG